MEEYKQLADMNNRGTCPRCEGFGFIHASKEKHDKPIHARCKKCIDCIVCDSSGVTLGVIKCARCSAKGFYHSPRAPQPHILSDYVKCFDCIICVDCQGQCVINSQRFEELKKVQVQKLEAKHESINPAAIKPGLLMMPPRMPDNMCFVGGKLPPLSVIDPERIHSHMAGIIGIPITEKVIKIIKSITKDLDVKVVKTVQSVCPRCLGAGYRHDSSLKHDKKSNEKCKLCTPCKGIIF
jgi:xanthosine utilization system XapX-like protein